MLFLLVVLLVIVVLAATVITVLVKGNESLKVQHRAYVVATNSVYDNHSNVIIGLQAQVEDLLAKRADDQAVITSKDLHVAGLIAEFKLATEKVAVLEKLAAEAAVELEEATASEFALKAKLANVSANYAKVEAYVVFSAKKSKSKEFDDCLFEDDYIMEVEKKLGIHWFK